MFMFACSRLVSSEYRGALDQRDLDLSDARQVKMGLRSRVGTLEDEGTRMLAGNLAGVSFDDIGRSWALCGAGGETVAISVAARPLFAAARVPRTRASVASVRCNLAIACHRQAAACRLFLEASSSASIFSLDLLAGLPQLLCQAKAEFGYESKRLTLEKRPWGGSKRGGDRSPNLKGVSRAP
jgi:hypothetical protein